MRNVLEYPLTPAEVLTAIDFAVEQQAEKRYIGDQMLWGLSAIQSFLKDYPNAVDLICQHDLSRVLGTHEKSNQDATA